MKPLIHTALMLAALPFLILYMAVSITMAVGTSIFNVWRMGR